MPKDLKVVINQIEIMGDLAVEADYSTGANLKNRAVGDIERIANSAWLNLYDFLAANGINPDKHFNKSE